MGHCKPGYFWWWACINFLRKCTFFSIFKWRKLKVLLKTNARTDLQLQRATLLGHPPQLPPHNHTLPTLEPSSSRHCLAWEDSPGPPPVLTWSPLTLLPGSPHLNAHSPHSTALQHDSPHFTSAPFTPPPPQQDSSHLNTLHLTAPSAHPNTPQWESPQQLLTGIRVSSVLPFPSQRALVFPGSFPVSASVNNN